MGNLSISWAVLRSRLVGASTLSPSAEEEEEEEKEEERGGRGGMGEHGARVHGGCEGNHGVILLVTSFLFLLIC